MHYNINGSEEREITVLCNQNTSLHQFIIQQLAFEYKTIKIVSKQIYQFKKLEEELYHHYGIAIQFSNSYQKSLAQSEIIVNLDFTELEINEYQINLHAIIINTEKIIKIKSKLFEGIVVNNCRITFSKTIKKIFLEEDLLHRYEMVDLYESLIDWKYQNYAEILKKIEKDKVNILNLIGNNGIIQKKEFKIVNKSIDKT